MENAEIATAATPEAAAENNAAPVQETKPASDGTVTTIPVKFNKQIKNLSIDEATELAQKGMKYDLIRSDFENLRKLAADSGHSIAEFLSLIETEQGENHRKEVLEKCGGNEELAAEILELENKKAKDRENGFEELKKEFPEISEIGMLPDEVTDAAKEKGTMLLDEYLRYLLKQKRGLENKIRSGHAAENASIGSQRESDTRDYDPDKIEFLRGIWGK